MKRSQNSAQKKAKFLLIAGSIVIISALVTMNIISKGIALFIEGVFLILINFIDGYRKKPIRFGKWIYYIGFVLILSGLCELSFLPSGMTLLIIGILLLAGGIYHAVTSARKGSS
jgi:amino acid transporter